VAELGLEVARTSPAAATTSMFAFGAASACQAEANSCWREIAGLPHNIPRDLRFRPRVHSTTAEWQAVRHFATLNAAYSIVSAEKLIRNLLPIRLFLTRFGQSAPSKMKYRLILSSLNLCIEQR
jgi:hypothetical protein